MAVSDLIERVRTRETSREHGEIFEANERRSATLTQYVNGVFQAHFRGYYENKTWYGPRQTDCRMLRLSRCSRYLD